ncbi:MAG: efflux RND transporter permease subunit [Ignavibacteriales bacterium]|nr:efflux RND transporter permease subunit [Ignavibacteriales bacterium]
MRGIGLAHRRSRTCGSIVVSASVEGVPILHRRRGRRGDRRRCPGSGAVTRDGKGESVAGMVIMLKGENGKDVADRVKARIAEIADDAARRACRSSPSTTRPRSSTAPSHTVTEEPPRGVAARRRRPVRLPGRRARGAARGRGHPAVDARRASSGCGYFGVVGEPDVARRHRLRPDRGRRRGDDGELRPAARRARRPASPTSGRPGRVTAGAFFIGAATEVARPILFGVLIIVAVYLPVFTLEGLEGKMFRPMAITVCSAILGSLLLSLTAVPVGVVVPAEARRRRARGPVVRAAPPLLRRTTSRTQMDHRAPDDRRWPSSP